GMERLHAAVHHLGESSHIAHVDRGEAGAAERPRRAPGRDELPPEVGELASELDEAGLVGHGEKCARHSYIGMLDMEIVCAHGRGLGDGALAAAATIRASERRSRRSSSSAGEWL